MSHLVIANNCVKWLICLRSGRVTPVWLVQGCEPSPSLMRSIQSSAALCPLPAPHAPTWWGVLLKFQSYDFLNNDIHPCVTWQEGKDRCCFCTLMQKGTVGAERCSRKCLWGSFAENTKPVSNFDLCKIYHKNHNSQEVETQCVTCWKWCN